MALLLNGVEPENQIARFVSKAQNSEILAV
jgi:hypothetical protein